MPNVGKVVGALAFFSVFVPFLKQQEDIVCVTYPCEEVFAETVLRFLQHSMQFEGVFLLNLLVGVVVSYFIGCLAVNLFERYK